MIKGAKTGLESFDISVVGIPYDGGVSYKPGAALAPGKIREISKLMPFVTDAGMSLGKLDIIDEGDFELSDEMSPCDIFKLIREAAKEKLRESFLMTIGGDHSISGPIFNALGDVSSGSVGIIFFDAHTDLSFEFDGSLYSHACPLRRGLENANLFPENVVLLGVRSFEEEPLDFISEHSIENFSPSDFEKLGVGEIARRIISRFRKIDNVYISVDIDVLDPAFAPGTGIPDAGGLSSCQLLSVLRQLWPLNIVGADIVEVAPNLDLNDITSIAGYKIIKEIFGLVLKRKNLGERICVI